MHDTSGTAVGIALPGQPRLLGDMLDSSVRRFGSRNVLDFMGRTLTYAELGQSVDRAARGLQDLGVVKGTRVALCLPNTPYYPILFFAILKAGGIVVNVNPLYVERELAHLLEDSGATIIATCDITEIHARVLKVAGQMGVKHVITCPIASALPTLKSIAYRIFKRAEIAHAPSDARHCTFDSLLKEIGRAHV